MKSATWQSLAATTVMLVAASWVNAQSIRSELQLRSTTNEELVEKLKLVVRFDQPFEGELREIVTLLSSRLDVTILYDSVAFRNGDPPLDNVDSTKVLLPILRNVRLETVFRKLLDPLDGQILLRGDHLEISTKKEAAKQSGHRPIAVDSEDDDASIATAIWPEFRSFPIAHLTARNRPLSEIVAELAERYPNDQVFFSSQAGLAVERRSAVLWSICP